MRPIGGFFELELPHGGNKYHEDAIGLSTGRACIGVFIEQVRPKKVFVPHYTCDATFHPFQQKGISLELYEIDENLEPLYLPQLKSGEYFLYTNYFGVKEEYIRYLVDHYRERVFVDNTHCFFHKGYPGVWSFTSARKHFGVPDGAFLYAGAPLSTKFLPFEEITLSPYLNRLLGNQVLAFEQYQAHEASLNCDINGISIYSYRVLGTVDFEKVQQRRKANFDYLQERLQGLNRLGFMKSESPFCYPLWPKIPISHRDFHNELVFVPSYWKEIQNRVTKDNAFSVAFSASLLPLPVDHRYGREEMDRMVDIILSKSF